MYNKEQAFTTMVGKYKKTIYTVCHFFSKDEDEVQDYFQEILINLWKGFQDFRGESSLKTWIWRVSLNTCNNQERKKKRSVQTVPLSVDIDLYNDTDTHSKQIQQLYERISRLDVFDRAIILLLAGEHELSGHSQRSRHIAVCRHHPFVPHQGTVESHV